MDKVRAWLEEKSAEAAALFPKHGHLFLIVEDDAGDHRERQIVSNMSPKDVANVVEDLLEETIDNREGQKKAN
jgi:hypothetical protein